ncbi:hypothetical protein ABD80_19405 [Bacillus atrophaeus]|nr:hypothetical protein A1D11_10595 [Bacillus subtilis subsp. globigii]MBG9761965.1 hypothetical protein [Bacillus atrophaeus]
MFAFYLTTLYFIQFFTSLFCLKLLFYLKFSIKKSALASAVGTLSFLIYEHITTYQVIWI